ncbi:MAG TPA: hypothetical protein VGO40_17365 [Longimicrobium sp.]|nr:hypothetical protein [Longimicrobium sp.]
MQTGYPAARAVAATVAEHLASHLAAARARGFADVAPQPDEETIAALVDLAFWASLQREEGRAPQISLAFVPPETGAHAMVFEHALAADPRGLARVAPAVERPGIHLGAWPDDEGALRVWGTTRSVPLLAFVIEVVEPGLLVLKQRRGDEHDKFGTIAVLAGDHVQVVDEAGASLPDCPDLLTRLLGFEVPDPVDGAVNVLIQLAVSMRAHRRGGSLLVVPADAHGWRESAAHPIPYLVRPFSGLAELLAADADEQQRPAWRESLQRAVEAVAGLTAVDGATVMNARHEVLAFGVKLARRRGSERVERVTLTAPVVGDTPSVVDPSQLGGTRHLSAAQFVHDQRDALAMVASQDGRFTVFAWSPCEQMVHAHRVETLLM